LLSFRAFSYGAHFHSTPSLITPIFIPRLLLQRLFSFPALSLIFISRILLIRLFSLCKYQHKLSQCLDQVEPFPRPYLVGGASMPPGLQKPYTAGQVSCLGDERCARGAAPLPTLVGINPAPLPTLTRNSPPPMPRTHFRAFPIVHVPKIFPYVLTIKATSCLWGELSVVHG
jgi:hypothetical protein